MGSQGSSPNQSKVLTNLSLVSADVLLTYANANIGLQELSGRAQPDFLKALEKVWWVQWPDLPGASLTWPAVLSRESRGMLNWRVCVCVDADVAKGLLHSHSPCDSKKWASSPL